MRNSCVLIGLIAAVLLTPNQNIRCQVLHGTVSILPYYMPGCECGWDQAFHFASQTIVSLNSPNANLAFSENPRCCEWYWFTPHDKAFFYLPDSIESLETVPETGPFVDDIAPTGTYVMKTEEDYWVKFTVHESTGTDVVIEYFVQTDGSRYFGPVLATTPTTWGRVKAMYR